MIPTWLQRQLEHTGRWNSDGISRALSTAHCRCGQQVLRGLDSDVAAITAVCDPTPVDQVGELLALLAGRMTFTLTHRAGRWEISGRDPWRIKGRRPATVLAEHRCGSPPLPAAPPPPEPTRTGYTEEPTW